MGAAMMNPGVGQGGDKRHIPDDRSEAKATSDVESATNHAQPKRPSHREPSDSINDLLGMVREV